MFETNLFLGFILNEDYQEKLETISPNLKLFFIQDEGEYLKLVHTENATFLGKFLGEITDYSTLELAYEHILSLLKRLVPSHSYSKQSLFLLSLPVENN